MLDDAGSMSRYNITKYLKMPETKERLSENKTGIKIATEVGNVDC